MTSLEQSVTLEEVFAVVSAKRVPLAPELAGYLTLEIAEGANAQGGEVDPRHVYIGDEGTVALVRPRRENPADAETSIRQILGRLLDASGSQTPALGAAAKRPKPTGVPGLVEELEAALIPVNRAAGRRALARLAREVKRVTLGVGRNRGSSPSYSAVRDGVSEPAPSSRAPSRPFVDEVSTARREVPEEVLASSAPSQPDVPPASAARERSSAPASPLAVPLAPPAPGAPASSPTSAAPVPAPATADGAADELPTIEIRKEALEEAQPSLHVARRDAVDELLDTFGVSSKGEQHAARELKALAGLDPTPPPPGSEDVVFSPDPPRAEHGADVESLLAISDAVPPPAMRPTPPSSALQSPPTSINPRLAHEPIADAPPPRRSPITNEPVAAPPREAASRNAPTAPSLRRRAPSTDDLAPPRAPRETRILAMTALALLVAGTIAVWVVKPEFFGGRSAARDATARPQPSASPLPATAATAPRCKATLAVDDVPTNAEVLLRVGQAPVDVERMPVGARLEFVATAEGYAPKRTVVPAGASWDSGPDGKPRFEVAVQLDKTRHPNGVDNWPAGEPGSEVGGKGAPGTVHLVSTPRGAEIWLLAGIAPEARIDQLKCGSDVDVLVAGPTTFRKRLHVPATAFKASGGGDPTATVSVTGK